jgi:predicted DNA-binding transcriptional regulator AlpA
MPEYFTANEAATYLRCSRSTFYRFGIPRVQLSERIARWRKVDLDRWAEQHLEGATAPHLRITPKTQQSSTPSKWDWLD